MLASGCELFDGIFGSGTDAGPPDGSALDGSEPMDAEHDSGRPPPPPDAEGWVWARRVGSDRACFLDFEFTSYEALAERDGQLCVTGSFDGPGTFGDVTRESAGGAVDFYVARFDDRSGRRGAQRDALATRPADRLRPHHAGRERAPERSGLA